MIDRVLVSADAPLQTISRERRSHGDTVVDARFDLCGLFIIIPRDQLQIGKLLSRAIQAIDFGKRLQPRLSALLPHDAVRAPTGQGVVKSFICRSYDLLAGKRHSRVVETGKIAYSVIGGSWHHPRVAAVTERVAEAIIVLKKE